MPNLKPKIRKLQRKTNPKKTPKKNSKNIKQLTNNKYMLNKKLIESINNIAYTKYTSNHEFTLNELGNITKYLLTITISKKRFAKDHNNYNFYGIKEWVEYINKTFKKNYSIEHNFTANELAEIIEKIISMQ